MSYSFYQTLLGGICICIMLILGLLAHDYVTTGIGLNPGICLLIAFVAQTFWLIASCHLERIYHEQDPRS